MCSFEKEKLSSKCNDGKHESKSRPNNDLIHNQFWCPIQTLCSFFLRWDKLLMLVPFFIMLGGFTLDGNL
jgi:hypothetical protein